MALNLALEFIAPTSEAATQIGILLVRAIQDQLTGERHGRWYPIPGNAYYDKNAYKSLPPEVKKKVNYSLKFTGTTHREEIIGAAYRASAPGESPAARTGRLRQSFYMLIGMTDKGSYRVTLQSNVYYADDMEHGTEKVDARPFLEPAVEKSMPQIVAIQHDFLYKVLRGQTEI